MSLVKKNDFAYRADPVEESLSSKSRFPLTRWSLIVDVREADVRSREEALAELCETYWYPVYAFVRRSGKGPEDAQDLTQGFFLDFLKRDAFSQARPDCGRMRTFVLTALQRYLAKSHRDDHRQKRGGGTIAVSIDETDLEGRYLAEPVDRRTPDLIFEQQWAQALFEKAFSRLRAVSDERNFEHLKPFLAKGEAELSYAEVAALTGKSESAVAVAVFRLRKRFRNFLEEEIRHTLASENEFDDELRNLLVIFQSQSE